MKINLFKLLPFRGLISNTRAITGDRLASLADKVKGKRHPLRWTLLGVGLATIPIVAMIFKNSHKDDFLRTETSR